MNKYTGYLILICMAASLSSWAGLPGVTLVHVNSEACNENSFSDRTLFLVWAGPERKSVSLTRYNVQDAMAFADEGFTGAHTFRVRDIESYMINQIESDFEIPNEVNPCIYVDASLYLPDEDEVLTYGWWDDSHLQALREPLHSEASRLIGPFEYPTQSFY